MATAVTFCSNLEPKVIAILNSTLLEAQPPLHHALWLVSEHMLFYASEKYPKEDSYNKFLTEVISSREQDFPACFSS